MLVKVKVFHHSYPLAKDLQVGEVVDLPDVFLKGNEYFYEPVHERLPVETVRFDRAKAEKDLIKRKVVRADEVAGLSVDQLIKLQKDNPGPTQEQLVEKALARKLGTLEVLERLEVDQLQALIDGSK